MIDLTDWRGVAAPDRVVLEGRYARLEPLSAARHGDDLFQASTGEAADRLFRYLFEPPPPDRATFQAWLERVQASEDPLFFAVIDRVTGRAEGRQTLMRIDTTHGVIEVGNILWGPTIARTRTATEALMLFAEYVFETLGYRRFEWKCNDRNEPSKRAALRFGFQAEGVFRQHMVVKGENRDTAWFSMVDSEWSVLKTRYEAWLDPANFDANGRQRTSLAG